MKRTRPLPLDLRGLILFFVVLSVLATLCNSLIVAYRVQRDALIHSALEANSAYAAKVASSMGVFLDSTHSRLKYSAEILAAHWDDPLVLMAESSRLRTQDSDFNSIAILDASGKVLQASSPALRVDGLKLASEAAQQALKQRRPLISPAYVSVAGHLVVFISQPIINSSGQFLGVVGGAVYLQEKGALHTVISNHFHHEGTQVFVVDVNHRILYHPNPKRIGEVLKSNLLVESALRGGSGAMAISNSQGIPMLAGYAQVPDAQWALVAQQPRDLALAPLGPLMLEMIVGVIPAGIAGFGLILAGTVLIARPLRQLSAAANQLAAPDTTAQLLRVHAWYRDVSAIRQAMLTGVQLLQQRLGRLSHEAQSDPLTGLANRRAMTTLLDMLAQTEQSYSVLALDIDHFKRVNDTYGHDVGDLALKHVAEILKKNSRASDLACRTGGEEFTLVMPDTPIEVARSIAERIRENVAASEAPQAGKLTISIGVALRNDTTSTPDALLKLADERLYRAKQNGRNQVIAHNV
ncbi:sensor domain-containing diguanylate cyclase [Pseudomonas resinovorans]|uniref:diguanylate cyclase n=1 Tax=Metapseudomonas resinovorans TaxID=53412 RepID=A0ABT4Y9B1_METRE|nr:sensor domain-containing diguanylate cyclase [Pseudomonas resinovorans]MDA8485465.1 sensor domain-containing diguanylate cyclase [Pseudomonas resinovorans]